MKTLMRAARLVASNLAVLTAGFTAAAEQPLAMGPEDGVVLLRNGQVLRGRIAHTGDQYVVSLTSVEIRLKCDTVEHVCRDLEEGYRRKRADIEHGKVQDRLELAQWCIRHELFGYAARELSDAIAADPRHPRIALVE